MAEHANDGGPSAEGQAWLSLVGIGEDGVAGLAPATRAALERAETVFGGRRHLDLLPEQDGQERIAWPSPLTDGLPWVEARRGRPVCVLASGDPFWFGIGATLARRLPPEEMSVFPAPSAFSLAAARLGWPLQEVACLSVHGRDWQRVLPHFQEGARLLVLSWDGATPARLAHALEERGLGASRLVALEHVGGALEGRVEARAADWQGAEVADLNTVAIHCRAEAVGVGIARTAGRPEADFDHDGSITKREVRAVVLAHLAPRAGELLWDIGAGSGAIAIEWMLADPANGACAVEAKPERLERIADNARAFGVPGLIRQGGKAPAALADLPAPQAVFIGGGLTTPGLVEHCYGALPAGGRLAATSVTVEGDGMLAQARERFGGQLVRLGVDRAEPLGSFQGWSPQRPVTLWCVTHP